MIEKFSLLYIATEKSLYAMDEKENIRLIASIEEELKETTGS